MVEESHVGSSESNGVVERAVEEQIRVILLAQKARLGKLRSKWDYGIFVGVREERTWQVRSVRRLPEDVRWSSDIRELGPPYDVEPIPR